MLIIPCLIMLKTFNRSPHGSMSNSPNSLYDEKHGIKMGVPTDGCDDGKVSYRSESPIFFVANLINFLIAQTGNPA